ncbi:zinc finger protein 346 [Nerophis ophidion]|uniref:zinc finger protein 346 n=1 Tax=Nerophis ophidion TaxID=159077 RepID=UPI002AE00732|nr:zinc finger protein 346 [Nerophis ophidion]
MAVAMQTDDFPYLPSGLEQVNKMIKEHGDLFTDSQCSICNAVLISESQKLAHYQSKKHGNKVRRYFSTQNEKGPESKKFKTPASDKMETDEDDPMKICDICKMTFTSSVMAQSHYQGKIHAKNLKLKSAAPQTQAQAAAPAAAPKKKAAADKTDNLDDKHPNRFCSACQASFNNVQMAEQHYAGKKHKKQMAKVKLLTLHGKPTTPAAAGKGLMCNICNIELNSVDQYQSHISGAKHKNQMKKSGEKSDDKNKSADENAELGDDNGDDDQCGSGYNQSGNGDFQYETEGQQFEAKDASYDDTFYNMGDDEFVTEGALFGSADDQFNSLNS